MEKKYIVYQHISPNEKIYIGITSQSTKRRWRNGEGYKNNEHFYNAILKCGWENFKHEILFEGLSKEKAEEIEKKLIIELDTTNPSKGYNLRDGGGSNGGFNEEQRKRMSEARKGKGCGKRNPNIGEKISKAKKGHKVSDDTKSKISETLKGKYIGKDNPTSKPIKCIETGETFDCARDACKKYNINPSNMCSHLKGRKKSVNKLHFEYISTNND